VADVRRLEMADNTMLRGMCAVTLKDRVRYAELMVWLGIECVEEVVSHGRLRWYRHIERRDRNDWV